MSTSYDLPRSMTKSTSSAIGRLITIAIVSGIGIGLLGAGLLYLTLRCHKVL